MIPLRLLSTLLCLLLPILLTAQPDTGLKWEQSARTLFNEWSTNPAPQLELTIETDMRQLLKGKLEEEYQAATLTYPGPDGATVRWDTEIRTRGNRRKEVCYFPPTKFKFDKTMLLQHGVLPFNKIKLVNECRATKGFSDFLLKEYLAYRLYNVVSPASFRVRLARFRYLDSEEKEKPAEMYGIVLEPEDELTARLDAVQVELGVTYFVHLDDEQANRLAFFQYMIGNTDWNVANMHNLITLKLPEVQKLTPIPYDFDYCGMVGTPYAVPHESLPIKDVRQRYHKGQEMSEAELAALVEQFKALEPAFRAVCREVEHLDPKVTEEAIRFLEYFFKMLDNPKALERVFVKGRQ